MGLQQVAYLQHAVRSNTDCPGVLWPGRHDTADTKLPAERTPRSDLHWDRVLCRAPPDGHALIYKIPLGRLCVRVMSLRVPIRLFSPKSLCHHTLNSWLSSWTRSFHTANTAYKHAFEKEKRTQQRSSWLPWDPFSTLTWWVLSISITVICDWQPENTLSHSP